MENIDNAVRVALGIFIGVLVTVVIDFFADNREIAQLKEANKYKYELILEYENYRDSVECGASYDEISDRIDSLYLQEL